MTEKYDIYEKGTFTSYISTESSGKLVGPTTPVSVQEAESFLSSFMRVATDGNKRDVENVQSYVDSVRKIPHYETLNVQTLWAAFLVLGQVEKSERTRLLTDKSKVFDLFYENEYVKRVISNLLPLKDKDEVVTNNSLNIIRKLKAQVYCYVRLILLSE
jgi:hypothetical protein